MQNLLTLTLLILSLGVFAQERIALVIGNADYEVSSLNNALNDAQYITQALENLYFKVTLVENADKRAMKDAIYEFSSKLNKDTVGLFYYAGHAVQYRGENYLIPINALSSIKELRHLEDEAVRSGIVSREMAVSQSQLNFIFLDSCRDNPLPAESRGIVEGLAKSQDAKGTLIAYSTSPGRTAEDGEGRNSPYTKNLLNFINTPNQPIELMLKDVKDAVSKDTNGYQLPWYESSITGNFCFKTTNDSCATAVITIIDNPYLEDLYDLEVIDLENGDHYVGQIKDGKFNGKGVLTYKTGAKHQGEFLDGKKHGEGKITQLNGNSFEGNFINDVRHGKGTLKWISGAQIETEWENDKRIYPKESLYENITGNVLIAGYGIKKDIDNSHYLGEFEYGKLNGQGIYTSFTGLILQGEFTNDQLNGKGSLTKSNGDYYEGQFIDGFLNGKGFAIFSEGSRYDGEFKSGEITGIGKYTMFDGSSYEGSLVDGIQQGFGKLISADGSIFIGEFLNGGVSNGEFIYANGDHYKGEMKNSSKHGYGIFTSKNSTIEGKFEFNIPVGYIIMTYPDGTIKAGDFDFKTLSYNGSVKITYSNGGSYNGGYKNEYKNGQGVLILSDGSRYEGEFIQGHVGYATYTGINGERYEGEFIDGLLNGYGTYTGITGERYKGDFKNNLYHGKGILYFPSGDSVEGNFIDGDPKGEVIFTLANGKKTIEYLK